MATKEEVEGEGEIVNDKEKLICEYLELKKKIENMESHNKALRSQLKWNRTSPLLVKETEMSFGQQRVYASHIETMREMFQKYETDKKGWILIEHVPTLHYQLGEKITPQEQLDVVKELKLLCRSNGQGYENCISFEQFVTWWVRRIKKRDSDRKKFQLITLDECHSGKFNFNKIRKRSVGRIGTLSYRIRYYYQDEDYQEKPISPWHDIPLLRYGGSKNMSSSLKGSYLMNWICEIPKWTRDKFEITVREKYNPIRQDVMFGKLRKFDYGDMMFNYGVFPQTWNDPRVIPDDTGKRGDNNPLTGVEIGTRQMEVSDITCVKVLGVLGLIDQGETDWKIVCINIGDPLATKINDIGDVETHIPGCISAIREYFRIYKVVNDKEPNEYAFGEMPKGKKYAIKVLEEAHKNWSKLMMHFHDGVAPSPLRIISKQGLMEQFEKMTKM